MRTVFFFCMACFSFFALSAQQKNVVFPDSLLFSVKKIWIPVSGDSLKKQKAMKQMLIDNKNKNFLAFSIDSIFDRGDSILLMAFQGNVYDFFYVKNRYTIHENDTLYSLLNRKVKFTTYKKMLQVELKELLNKGHLFSKIYFDDFYFHEDRLYCNLYLEPNKKILLDTLVLKGNLRLNATYLTSFYGLEKGKPLSYKSLVRFLENGDLLKFAKNHQKNQLEINQEKAYLYAFLSKRNANRFNLLLGISQGNDDEKFQFTGNADLLLFNSFGLADELKIDWKKLKNESQNLDMRLAFPYIGLSNFGLNAQLKMFKKDSSYLNFEPKLGLSFLFTEGNFISVFYRYCSSIAISGEFLTLPYEDIVTSSVGIEFDYQKLDDVLYPKNGYFLNASIDYGSKKKEGVQTEQSSYFIETGMYKRISNALVTYFSFKSQGISSFQKSTAFLENELFRFGGIKNLRGIEEESLYASFYAVTNSEVRFMLGADSYFVLFYDLAYWEKESSNQWIHDLPFGFGFGMNYRVKGGNIELYYALARQYKNPVLVRNAKIHIGYNVRF